MTDATFQPQDWSHYAGPLRRMARELIGEEDLAEDLVQSAWLRALERPPRMLSLAWLKRVVYSGAQDHHRRRGRSASAEDLLRLGDESHDPLDSSEIAQQLELQEVVVSCVRSLEEPYREAVYLRYFEDLTPTEIAQRLGAPVKTIKTRLNRALGRLRERMEQQFGDAGRWQQALAPLAWIPIPKPSSVVGPTATVSLGAGILMKKVALAGAVLAGVFGLYQIASPARGVTPLVPGASFGSGPGSEVAEVDASTVSSDSASREEPGQRRAEILAEVDDTPVEQWGALEVEVVWFDGSPAEGLAVDFLVERPQEITVGIRREYVDGGGPFLVEGLPVGGLVLKTDRGDKVRTEVVAQETERVRIEVARNIDVAGRVLDEEGNPLANASVWLTCGTSDWLGGHVIATTGADGLFTARSVPPRQSLGAIASGYEPSVLLDLELVDKSSVPVEVELNLTQGGGALRVRVTHGGEPVPDALVAYGDHTGEGRWRTGGGTEEGWAPRSQASDQDGWVQFEGLAVGAQALAVRAATFPIYSTVAEIHLGETTELFVELDLAASVSGVARNADGTPAPGALVRAYAQPMSEVFIQSGQIDFESAFGCPMAIAGEDGSYLLEPVAPGRTYLYASPDRDGEAFGSMPHAREILEIGPGGRVTWDVTFDPGPTIQGRVLYQDGEPVPHVFLTATDEESALSQTTTALEDGTFAFYNLRPASYSLRVQILDKPKDAAPLMAQGVWPSPAEVLLEASFPKPYKGKPGEVRFRFQDSGQRLPHADALSFSLHTDRRIILSGTRRDGEHYIFPNLEPGDYSLNAFAGENVIHVGEWFELGAGEVRDLGLLESTSGGSLQVQLRRPPSTESIEPRLFLKHAKAEQGRWVDFEAESSRLVTSLEPGTWSLALVADDITTAWSTVEVQPNQTGEASFDVRPAVSRELSISYPPSKTLQMLHLIVLDENGGELANRSDAQPNERGRPYRRTLKLPLGRIQVRVETDAGIGAELDFVMTSLDPDQEPVEVVLR